MVWRSFSPSGPATHPTLLLEEHDVAPGLARGEAGEAGAELLRQVAQAGLLVSPSCVVETGNFGNFTFVACLVKFFLSFYRLIKIMVNNC